MTNDHFTGWRKSSRSTTGESECVEVAVAVYAERSAPRVNDE